MAEAKPVSGGQQNFDTEGRAYGRPPPAPDEVLVLTGPGTPGGELLRRFWQPVALSKDLQDLPIEIKILDEVLIVFRDKCGRPGLVYPRCMHRGTSLIYGKIEPEGIRCPYHGWLYDTQGRCLEMPCEPANKVKEKIRQPWYPVVEYHGIVFAYLGPAGKEPVFPRISLFEELADDEIIVAYGSHKAPSGPLTLISGFYDYNWWNFFDNFMDPFHVYSLHSNINGTQFVETLNILPEVTSEYTADGVRTIQHRRLEDGRVHQRLSQAILPNMNCTATVTDDLGAAGIAWTVPRDDVSFRRFGFDRVKKGVDVRSNLQKIGMLQPGWGPDKPFESWTREDHQRWQTDYVTQKGQGDINQHSDEHLTTIDKATAMMRRMFRQQVERMEKGDDPIGVTFDEPYFVRITAGNAMLDESLNYLDGYDGR